MKRIPYALGSLLAVLLLGLVTACGGTSSAGPGAGGSTDPASGLAWISPSDLPQEGRETLALIDKGGPFPYPRNDGVVFQNREGVLPQKSNGYYHEYTVPTPGSQDRGARRIVTGEGGQYYYTGDHYDSFSRIRR
ncbi:MAG: ribonuclease [Nocardioides sp.]|nr:ribonuclease [Nocardioides sp.]